MKILSEETNKEKEETKVNMEEFRKTYTEELKRLDVSDDEELTTKMLSSKFKKKALKVHPDKTGEVNQDEEFKNLLNDYKRCTEALSLILKDEADQEQNEMAEFFVKHNLTKENTNSFTVLIENDKNVDWKDALKKMKLETEPKNLVNGGTQYKTEVLGNWVYIPHYANPSNGQSKLLIQGSMFHIKTFIIQILPVLYQKMCIKLKKRDQKNVQPKQNIAIRALLGKEITFKCDQCDVTYKRKINLVKHMRSKHPTQAKQIEKAAKVLVLPSKSNTNPLTTYKAPKGLSINPVTNHQKTPSVQGTHETTETTPTSGAPKDPTINNMEKPNDEPLMQSLNDFDTELDNILDTLKKRAVEVVDEQAKEVEQSVIKKPAVEKASESTIIDVTKPQENPDSTDNKEPTKIVQEDVRTLISQILTDMTDKAIVLPNWIQKEPEQVTTKRVEMEIFKEFEEDKDKDKEKSLPDEVYVCGECGMFGYERGRMLAHIEKTHSETQLEELKTENKRAYKELSEMKSTLYEVQFQLEESEQKLAETMREVICLDEDNRDKAKIVDSLLAERSTVDEYDEDGEELGYWNPNNDETTLNNEEPDVDRTSNRTLSASLDSKQQQCPKCDFVPSRPVYMKSHMLIKHKEDQTECIKCKKTFQTKKDLNDHIQKTHTSNLHSCKHCEAKFMSAHALKQHTTAVHTEKQTLPLGHPDKASQQNASQETSPKKFKCRICGKGHTSGTMLDDHLGQDHCEPAPQDRGFRNQECRRGPQCHFFAQNRCMFFHQVQYNQPRRQQNHPRQNRQKNQQQLEMTQPMQNQEQEWHEKIPSCRRGPGCVFWANGNCYFSHEEAMQDMWQQSEQQQQDQQPHQNVACRYQRDCRRVPYCPFQHYNEDFPKGMGRQTKR